MTEQIYVQSSDRLTIAAIAILVYLIANVMHEGVGHGLTCAAVGGRVASVTSVYCACDYRDLPRDRRRIVQAGGTAANLLLGAVLVAVLIFFSPVSPTWRYFLLLAALVNLFQAGGYLMIAPFGGFGDWMAFLDGMPARLAWQIGLTAAGTLISFAALYVGRAELAPFSQGQQAWLLTVLPYVVGGLVSCAIAWLNPLDRMLVVTSAGASTFGGTCWLLWVGYLATAHPARTDLPPAVVPSSPVLIALALAALAAWTFLLGPGISFAGAASRD